MGTIRKQRFNCLSGKQNFPLGQKSSLCQENADCFCCIEGIVHYEFVLHKPTFNQVFYNDVLIRLREMIHKKRPEKWQTGTWFFHLNNALSHLALSIREFIADKKIPIVPHPPFSSDLALCVFFLFPRLKCTLKEQRFQDIVEFIANTATELNALTTEQFQRTFKVAKSLKPQHIFRRRVFWRRYH